MNGNIENNERKVIMITGDKSKWYEQAIFIVNKNSPKESLPADIVKEAELIIDSYLAGKKHSFAQKKPPWQQPKAAKVKRNKLGIFTGVLFLICAAVLVFYFGNF